ncbi:glutathione S-transferase [Chiua virens]|nr:glutathione S-transferase [Chiua virens]
MTDTGKGYHNQCTGEALQTVQRHVTDEDITLFAGCFCPFVQRVWVTLEYLGIPYKVRPDLHKFLSVLLTFSPQYYEVDPYKKPKELLDLSPKGLVPALKLNDYDPPRAVNESTVIMDFLEDLASGSTKRSLFPPVTDPYARALVRLQSDHINRILVPAFYRYLQAQHPPAQTAMGSEFRAAIETLVDLFERAEQEVGGTGLWKDGGELGWADVMVGPWIFRATNVLKRYRGFVMPQGPKLNAWLERLLEHPTFKSTCSTRSTGQTRAKLRMPSILGGACLKGDKEQSGIVGDGTD